MWVYEMSEGLTGVANNEIIITDDVHGKAAVQTLSKNIIEVLNKHYPGHIWIVGVDNVAGVVNILNSRISGSMGVTLRINALNDFDYLKKQVMLLAGELLERYGIKRGAISETVALDIKRDFKGEAIHT